MIIDGDLSNLPIGHFVCAPDFERCRSRVDLEATGYRQRNQRSGDFLMNLDDALAEQVFDQWEDWTVWRWRSLPTHFG
jgi:hypothetical protein